MQVKDGAAWAALEYTKWAKEHGIKQPALKIIPAAIVYTNKSKYRSQVIMEFSKPIMAEDFLESFTSDAEGEPRATAKHLTATIERALVETTINAPDWQVYPSLSETDTLYAARMARDLLWEEERSINLDEFVAISQTLVDLFSTPELVPKINQIRRNLLTYYSLLQSSHLTNSSLSSLPLPLALDPHRHATLPSRLRTLSWLVAETLAMLVRLPFFVIPLLVHAPAYAVGYWGASLVEDEEETQAQNKVVFGLLLLMMVYGSMGVFVWAVLGYAPVGALLATAFVTLFARYHNSLINYNYEQAKRLLAAWRVLIGVWAPKHWDLSLHALAQYTIPKIPPENPWIDRTRARPSTSAPGTPTSTPSSPPLGSPPEKKKKHHRPPTRRIVRHVLRARIEAAKSLKSLFEQLERATDGKRVRASSHLARAFGGVVDPDGSPKHTADAVEWVEEPRGWRSAKEVVAFLRRRGAKIAQLEDTVAGEWAALSEGEFTEMDGESDAGADIVFVPSRSNLKEVVYSSGQ
ncbi:hypothetical protein EIP86_001684 [Pleurotus ostreatoroseus]|nr:hypothetical protein EIP86_001684 [Pleurotus ostreatoroseus]